MRKTLRSHGGWGIEGWSVITTPGKKANSQLCLCALDNEWSPGVTCKCSHSQCRLCVCSIQAVSQRALQKAVKVTGRCPLFKQNEASKETAQVKKKKKSALQYNINNKPYSLFTYCCNT